MNLKDIHEAQIKNLRLWKDNLRRQQEQEEELREEFLNSVFPGDSNEDPDEDLEEDLI